jgi:hypothetical protein
MVQHLLRNGKVAVLQNFGPTGPPQAVKTETFNPGLLD